VCDLFTRANASPFYRKPRPVTLTWVNTRPNLRISVRLQADARYPQNIAISVNHVELVHEVRHLTLATHPLAENRPYGSPALFILTGDINRRGENLQQLVKRARAEHDPRFAGSTRRPQAAPKCPAGAAALEQLRHGPV
jgi:hypothetical protein